MKEVIEISDDEAAPKSRECHHVLSIDPGIRNLGLAVLDSSRVRAVYLARVDIGRDGKWTWCPAKLGAALQKALSAVGDDEPVRCIIEVQRAHGRARHYPHLQHLSEVVGACIQELSGRCVGSVEQVSANARIKRFSLSAEHPKRKREAIDKARQWVDERDDRATPEVRGALHGDQKCDDMADALLSAIAWCSGPPSRRRRIII